MGLPPGRLIRARDHLGPVAIQPIIPTPNNTGANSQYLRTRDRDFFFFFLLVGDGAMISFLGVTRTAAIKSSFATILILVLAKAVRAPLRRSPVHDTGPHPSAVAGNSHPESLRHCVGARLIGLLPCFGF